MMRQVSGLVLACGLVAAGAMSAGAQPLPIKADGTIIKGYITYLSTDEQQGRRTLTPGYERMADWAAGKFKTWGLAPAGENGTYFQGVPMTGPRSAFVWAAGVPTLSVAGRPFYLRDNDFVIDTQSTPGTAVSTEVVFVGFGISAPAKGLDEYAGLDVKGKVVLVLKGSPADVPDARPSMGAIAPPAPAKPTSAEKFVDESTDQQKALTAYQKGAAGIMLYAAPAGGGMMMPGMPAAAAMPAMPPSARRAVEASPFKKPFLMVSTVTDRVFHAIMWRDAQETLRGFSGRLARIQTDIKGGKVRSARTGVSVQIKGYTATTLYGEAFKNHVGRNVIAKIEGSDPALKGQYVVIGGHLDHMGVTNGVVFNGADDNASGAATTMEVARLFVTNNLKPKRTVIFCLWTGEEQGLHGSNYYVAHPTDGVSPDRMVGYFNMDMVGLGDRIDAPGALNFPTIWDVIKRDQLPDVIGSVDPSTGGPGGSDYSAFIEKGIEALGLMTSGGGGHPDYHDAADDPAKMEAPILAKTAQFVLQGAWNLANEPAGTVLIADRQVQYDSMRFAPPDVSGGVADSWQTIKPATTEELIAAIGQRLRDGGAGATGARMMRRAPAGGRLVTGVRSSAVFGGSVALLQAAATAFNIGRVDVPASDGVWFGESVTESGKEALKAMEAAGVALHLVKPSVSLLGSVLDVATKPVLVSGLNPVPAPLVEKLKKNNALVVVSCEADAVAACGKQAGVIAAAVGKNNVLLSVGPSAARADATKATYLALIAAGWTKDEIGAAVGAGVGMMGVGVPGNLSRFQTPPPAMR